MTSCSCWNWVRVPHRWNIWKISNIQMYTVYQYIYTPKCSAPFWNGVLDRCWGVPTSFHEVIFFFREASAGKEKHFHQISNHQQKHSAVGPLSKVNSIHHTHHMGGESQLLRHHNFVWSHHVTTKGTTAEWFTPKMYLERSESYGSTNTWRNPKWLDEKWRDELDLRCSP